jgi:hypothetical protein
MGIEIATYRPKLKRLRRHDDEFRKAFGVGFRALRSKLQNAPGLDLSSSVSRYLDALEPEDLLDQTPLISLPKSVSDLRDYLGDWDDDVRPFEKRVVLGYWENEIVYANLNRPIELRDGGWFSGSLNLNKESESVTGEILTIRSDAYCAGCIEGTGTALLFDESEPDRWFLLNHDAAVLEPWRGTKYGVVGGYIKVGKELNICLDDNGWDAWV